MSFLRCVVSQSSLSSVFHHLAGFVVGNTHSRSASKHENLLAL